MESTQESTSESGVAAFDKFAGLISRCKVLFGHYQQERPDITVQNFFQHVPEAVDLSKKAFELIAPGKYIRYVPRMGLLTMPVTVVAIRLSSEATTIEDAFVIVYDGTEEGKRFFNRTELLRHFLRPRMRGNTRVPSYWPRAEKRRRNPVAITMEEILLKSA